MTVQVTGRTETQIQAGVTGALMNVVAVGASGGGYLTTWPTGVSMPPSASVDPVARAQLR